MQYITPISKSGIIQTSAVVVLEKTEVPTHKFQQRK